MSSPSPGASPPPANDTSPPPAAAQPPPATSPPPSSPTPPAASPPPASSPPPVPPATSPPPPVPPATSPPPPATPAPTISPPPPATPAPTTSPPAPATPSGSPPPATPSGSPPPATPSGSPPPTPDSSSSPPPPTGRTPSPPVARTPPPPGTARPSPPAPGTSRASPPPPSSSNSSPPSDSSSGISTGVVVGIAIGGVVLIALLSILFIFCKKKKRREPAPAGYYVPPHHGHKDDPYAGGPPQHWQHNAPPPVDHVVNVMPPKPSPPPAVASRPPHSPVGPSPPPPPPPFMSSSGGSGSNYSGSEIPLPPPSPGMALGFSKSTFTYEELAMATDGFSNANLLGQGGFGYVHRGVLPTGKEVAIKQLKAGSGQGEREFQAEVEIISRVHHKHLVSLVGYCITGTQRMLVYEFVPNDTLEFHLHGKGRPTMDWPTRLRIALGAAKGLAYLHEDCHPKIIHRDIKGSNILLDFNFEAKVADFGLAKFSSDANTHISTRVMGTFGYLAPEYAASGKLTDKSDVFSFGVMLLELITGRRPVDSANTFVDDSLVDWARPLLSRALEDGNFDSLVDQRLQRDYKHNEMARIIACAAACVRHSARRRPRMSQVVRALEGDVSLSDLDEGMRPGQSTVYSSYGSSDYDTSQYNEDMKKFRKMALASHEYGSSEYSGGPTSEYGLYPSGSSSEGQTTREMEMGKMKKDHGGFSGSS